MFSFRQKIKLAFPWTQKLQWRCARYFLVTLLLEKMLQWRGKDVLVQGRVMLMLLGEERTVRCKERDPVEGSHVGVCGHHLNGHIQDSEASIWTGPSDEFYQFVIEVNKGG
jgi:hypothetical protein